MLPKKPDVGVVIPVVNGGGGVVLVAVEVTAEDHDAHLARAGEEDGGHKGVIPDNAVHFLVVLDDDQVLRPVWLCQRGHTETHNIALFPEGCAGSQIRCVEQAAMGVEAAHGS